MIAGFIRVKPLSQIVVRTRIMRTLFDQYRFYGNDIKKKMWPIEDDEFHGRMAFIGADRSSNGIYIEKPCIDFIKNFGLLQMFGCPERDAWLGQTQKTVIIISDGLPNLDSPHWFW